ERETQICLSHAYGSTEEACCENTVWAVSNLLGGIPIRGYIIMDIGGIAAINDALGGVTVTLEDDFTHLDPAMAKGTEIKLKGKQAEYYVRGRMGVGAGTNISRMTRQRTFAEAVNKLILRGMQEDMNYIGGVLDDVSGHVDMNLSRGFLINTAYMSRDYERTGVHSIIGVHEIGEDGFMGFTPDPDALSELLTSLFFTEK
ncbi:MAG: LCP family protein, partial [Clostridia bacterium]|nr:LCP family protein [Clostridia bacterium]